MLGLLYDIHGNLPALEAVLADGRRRGVQRWLLGGDYALFGGWPAETVDLLADITDEKWGAYTAAFAKPLLADALLSPKVCVK